MAQIRDNNVNPAFGPNHSEVESPSRFLCLTWLPSENRVMGTGKIQTFPPTLQAYSSTLFLRDHFNPMKGRRAETALLAEFIPSESPLLWSRKPHPIQYLQ